MWLCLCTDTSEPWKAQAAGVASAESVCSPVSAATMVYFHFPTPISHSNSTALGKNGISEAVDPIVRHRCPVWTLQLHIWDIQNHLSGPQQRFALSCPSPSSPQAGSLTPHSSFSVSGSCHTALDPATITLRQTVLCKSTNKERTRISEWFQGFHSTYTTVIQLLSGRALDHLQKSPLKCQL